MSRPPGNRIAQGRGWPRAAEAVARRPGLRSRRGSRSEVRSSGRERCLHRVTPHAKQDSSCLLPCGSPFYSLLSFDPFAKLLAAAMQVGAHGANGQLERLRNLLVTTFLLMIKHQYGSLHRAKLLQLLFYRILKLFLGKLLLGIGAGMR